MACRDYEFDYEQFLKRGRDRLREMTDMLSRLGAAAPGVESNEFGKEVFDRTSQALCEACRSAEKMSTPLPADVAQWWEKHQACDRHDAELEQGLSPTPVYANLWEEHAARNRIQAQFPGVKHAVAVRAFEASGFRVVHDGRHIAMTDGTRKFLVPKDDPINGYAMAGLIRLAGLTDDEFRQRLGKE